MALPPTHHLAADVGGTHCRIRLQPIDGAGEPLEWHRPVADPAALRESLGAAVGTVGGWPAIERSVIGFAGPVQGATSVTMTNWTGTPRITLADLHEWMHPHRQCRVLNDMQLAGLGVLAARQQGRLDADVLHAGHARPGTPALLLAPGTGLGCLIISAGRRPSIGRLLASEFAHARASPLDQQHARLIDALSGELGRAPVWEDCVSGRGLQALHRLLGAGPSTPGAATPGAADIARQAVAGTDPTCIAALDAYYRCLAAAAQALALGCLPRAGIYLYGASTRHNLPFVRRSGFLATLHHHPTHAALLASLPVQAVSADLNLDGGLWLCQHAGARRH